ncbi:MAG: FAD-dependent oxidoreductase [Xanthobacteraceae bacterium]
MTSAPATFRHPSALAPLVEGWAGIADVLNRAGGAVIDLLIRLWLAKVFFVSGVLHAANWDATLQLYAGAGAAPGFGAKVAAVLGTGIELVCPLLLVVGLATRAAAIPLLLLTIGWAVTGTTAIDHFYWIALLGILVVRGAGALSVDYLIAPHLAGSAIPLGSSLREFAAFKHRYLLPPVELLVRVGIAWLLWSHGFSAGSVTLQIVGLMLCVLFALGLATRAVALILAIVSLSVFSSFAPLGDSVLRFLLFVSFVLHGAGPLSLDRLMWSHLQQLCPNLFGDRQWLEGAPNVVIVGAGFGGLAAAMSLRHAWANVTLIDKCNYHLFQPLLYQVATATLSPADIAQPIRALLREQENCRVLMGEVTGVDSAQREVLVDELRLPFDYLVLATGARQSYFGHDDWARFAPSLKKVEDATMIRSRILAAFEQAEAAPSEAERGRLMTFVLVGAGPTGVELAGAIAELAHQSLQGEFRAIDPATARVLLVQAGPIVLPAMPKELSLAAAESLKALGVEVMTNARVEAVDAGGVQIGDKRVEAGTVIWTAGVRASEANEWIKAEHDHAGRIVVGPDLAVPDTTNIFALGDTSSCTGKDGKPLPGLGAVAKQQGEYIARLIRARIEGRASPGPFRYVDYGTMATIGRKSAVADLSFVRLSGSIAWWLWGLVHVAFLVDVRSRVAVVFDWFWSYLTFNRSVRLITGRKGHAD